MPSESDSISYVSLIRSGLQGKDKAIGAYDEMLWRIRTGYVASLYGVFTLVLGFADKSKSPFPSANAGLVALLLITGFTICAAVLDFHFLQSKLRVVESKEALVDMSILLASGGSLETWRGASLGVLLQNSGEHRARVRWDVHPSPLPIGLLYLGTWAPLCTAVLLLKA